MTFWEKNLYKFLYVKYIEGNILVKKDLKHVNVF
jgi:hypothetical protein